MELPDGVLFVAVEIYLVLLLLLVIVLTILKKKINKIKQLESTAMASAPPTNPIEAFLKREITLSDPSLEQHEHKDKHLLNMRVKLLSAELDALQQSGKAPSEIQTVTQALTPFSPDKASITQKKRELSDPEQQKNINSKVRSLQSSLIKRNKLVIELTEKLNQHQDQTNTTNIDLSTGEGLKKNFDNEAVIIEQLREELRRSEQMCQDAQRKLEKLQSTKASQTIVTMEKNSKESTNNADQSEIDRLRAILEDLMSKYDGAKNQLEKLRRSNSEKRHIILRLEHEQKKMSSTASEEVSAIIEKLKTELRDSQMCTAVLESETDNLREKVHELTEEIDIIHQAEHEVAEPELKKDSKLGEFGRLLLDALIAITELNEPEDVATQLIKLAKGIDVNISFLLRNNVSTYWGGTDGRVDDKIKKILLSIDSSGDERWVETAGGVILSLDYCRVIVKGVKTNNSPVDLQRFAKTFSISNAAIKRMELQQKVSQQRNKLDIIIKKTKGSLSAMEVRHKTIIQEAEEAVKVFNSEFEQFSQSVDFSQLQSECITDIINDLSGRMEILFATGVSIDKSFIELMELLDVDDDRTIAV